MKRWDSSAADLAESLTVKTTEKREGAAGKNLTVFFFFNLVRIAVAEGRLDWL